MSNTKNFSPTPRLFCCFQQKGDPTVLLRTQCPGVVKPVGVSIPVEMKHLRDGKRFSYTGQGHKFALPDNHQGIKT
jgi:hypothetical protein